MRKFVIYLILTISHFSFSQFTEDLSKADDEWNKVVRKKNIAVENSWESVPIFPGCEGVKKSDRRQCFHEQMKKHVKINFRYPEIAKEMGIQGRVYVTFIISKDGSIKNIRTRGPDKNLEKEAVRIISKLPDMPPVGQKGVNVSVPFSTSIAFRLK